MQCCDCSCRTSHDDMPPVAKLRGSSQWGKMICTTDLHDVRFRPTVSYEDDCFFVSIPRLQRRPRAILRYLMQIHPFLNPSKLPPLVDRSRTISTLHIDGDVLQRRSYTPTMQRRLRGHHAELAAQMRRAREETAVSRYTVDFERCRPHHCRACVGRLGHLCVVRT